MEYQVWAEAFPDPPSFSAIITRVDPDRLDENGWSAVGAVTCVSRGERDRMGEMVDGLFRCFVDLPDEDRVVVHLKWLGEPPAGFLE